MHWHKFKQTLANKVVWLEPLVPSLNELLHKAIHDFKIEETIYDPLLVEPLTKDISTILDRCLTYRRDAQELEILAVRAAVEYAKFKELVSIQRDNEIAALGLTRLHKERNTAMASAAAFDGSQVKLEQGFHTEAAGRAASLRSAIETVEQQEALIRQRWAITERYEDDAQERHKEPNNSNNYVDRMKNVIRFLAEDFQEATAKSKALVAGVRAIYNRDFHVPEIEADKALDELTLSLRNVARYLEGEGINDTTYDIVVPLAQPWQFKNGKASRLVDANELISKVMSGKTITFDLSDVFADQERVRLRGVGLSFGNSLNDETKMDPGRLPWMSAYRLRGSIWLPDMTVAGKSLSRAPLYFGNVSVYSGSAGLAWNNSPACYNVDPRGKWRLRIGPRAVHSLNNETLLTQVVYDLKLHLTVVSKFLPDAKLLQLLPEAKNE